MSSVREKLREIDTAIEKAISDAELDVRNIFLGDRTQVGDPRPPAIWVLFDDVRININPTINREEWILPVVVAATYQDRDSNKARKESEDLADAAGDAVLEDRTLGGLLIDTVRVAFYRGYKRVEGEESIYGAGVGLELRFLVSVR